MRGLKHDLENHSDEKFNLRAAKLWSIILYLNQRMPGLAFERTKNFLELHFILTSTVISSSNEDSDFFRNQKITNHTEKYRIKKFVFFYRQSIGLTGVSCYLCQYSFLPCHRQKSNWKLRFCKKFTFSK